MQITYKFYTLLVIILFAPYNTLQAKNNAIVHSYSQQSLNTAFLSAKNETSRTDDVVKAIVDEITTYSGLRRNFTVSASDTTENASAIIMSSGERYLLYNPNFVRSIQQKTRTYWSAISIMAHEVGHHLQGHTLNRDGSYRPEIEIEADEYSGFVIQKMGASLAEAQAAMNASAPETATDRYPAKKERLLAIRTGWVKASELKPLPREMLPNASFQPEVPKNQVELSHEINRYEVNEGVVKDSKTGLIWTRCSLGQTWTGSTCHGEAAKFSWDEIITKHFSYAGYNDWRIPSIAELKTLLYCNGKRKDLNSNRRYTKDALMNQIFPNVAHNAVFWSSSQNESIASNVWVTDFLAKTHRQDDRSNYFAIRLVRN
jgi:hypothetical protein